MHFQLKKNQSIDIKIGEIHRLENKTNKIVKIIEIQTGNYIGEDDIVRYEDKYKRISYYLIEPHNEGPVHSILSVKKLNEILKHDLLWDANTCKEYGLIDEII